MLDILQILFIPSKNEGGSRVIPEGRFPWCDCLHYPALKTSPVQ